jgi:hypothetical protein
VRVVQNYIAADVHAEVILHMFNVSRRLLPYFCCSTGIINSDSILRKTIQ